MNQLLRFGADYGWAVKDVKIKHQSEAQSRARRKHFTLEEYRKLLKTSRKRAREYANSEISAKKRGMLTNKHWQRNLLHDIILLLANSGMRVDEVKTVTWRDINWDNHTILLNTAGKTKSSRLVMVRAYGMTALKRIRERRLKYLKEHNRELKERERIHCLPNGVFVNSMKKGFRELLSECAFEYETSQDRHALTSLRHTYATLRLTTIKGKRASIRGLSKQMGTSQRMIERHYGHDVVEDYRDELLG